MSESLEHGILVRKIASNLSKLGGKISVFADLPQAMGYGRPPKVGGFIPDVYGRHRVSGHIYIGEAKTFDDLETERSVEQIIGFMRHANEAPKGTFILGGMGRTATRAKTVLRFWYMQYGFTKATILVFDGLDYWQLVEEEELKWLLS